MTSCSVPWLCYRPLLCCSAADPLVGRAVKVSTWRADRELNPGDFSWLSHTSDRKTGTCPDRRLVSQAQHLSVFCAVLRCSWPDRLFGLVVKASTLRAKDTGFESHLWQDFSGSSHTSDLETGTPVSILPGAWGYRVSAGTGWPGVSILRLVEVKS